MPRAIRLSRDIKSELETVTIQRYVAATNEYVVTLPELQVLIEDRATAGVDEDGAILLDSGYVGTVTPPITNIDQIQPDDQLVRRNRNNREEQKLFIVDITNLRGVQQLMLSTEQGSPAQ